MGALGTQYGALGQATQQLGAADAGLLAGLVVLSVRLSRRKSTRFDNSGAGRNDAVSAAGLCLTFIVALNDFYGFDLADSNCQPTADRRRFGRRHVSNCSRRKDSRTFLGGQNGEKAKSERRRD